MEDGKRLIFKSAFSIQKMLEMKPDEARKYFLTEFFLPASYNKWEMYPNYLFSFLNLGYNGKNYFPIITFGASAIDFLSGMANPLDQLALGTFESSIDRPFQNRTFGQAFDEAELSKGLMHAFKGALPVQKTSYNDQCPLLASIKSTSGGGLGNLTLNVLVKLNDRERNNPNILLNQGADRVNLIKKSVKYGRSYNVLTGDWTDLCEKDTADACPYCVAIWASKAKNNFYDDIGAN